MARGGAGRGRYDNNHTFTGSTARMVVCPHCQRQTTLGNYRMDAIRGKTIVICEQCHNPIPRGVA